MNKKLILGLDFVLIFGTLIIMMFLVRYSTPLVISPLDNLETRDAMILFSIENAEKLFIDDNINFTTPKVYNVVSGLKLDLEPGVYYWKAVGVRESEIRTLTVESAIILELKENQDGYNVVNAGNVNLNVQVYDKNNLVETMTLLKNSEKSATGNKFEGEMKNE